MNPIRITRNRTLILSAGIFVLLAAPGTARLHADEYDGLDSGDSKEMIPVSSTEGSNNRGTAFLPLPTWTHLVAMPPLPDTLKPLGRKAPSDATAVAGEKPPLAPPKDVPATATAAAKIAPPAPTPALVAVSPFLQWIKNNPQAAAAEARQQATAYQPQSASTPPGGVAPAVSAPGADNYWLPPLIDSAPVSAVSGGSAAIYSTPQR